MVNGDVVVFNFRDKLRLATSTTTESPEKKLSSQVIRVPDLECDDGYRRDGLGLCRLKF